MCEALDSIMGTTVLRTAPFLFKNKSDNTNKYASALALLTLPFSRSAPVSSEPLLDCIGVCTYVQPPSSCSNIHHPLKIHVEIDPTLNSDPQHLFF
jgi:hypothetical protein